jgi:mRNA interferase RelE/StbE
VSGRSSPVPYAITFTPAAHRELPKPRADDAARLRHPILGLALEPRPPGSQPVSGSRFRRIREGYPRVVYLIEESERVVLIARIARRADSTYRRLQSPGGPAGVAESGGWLG